MSIKQRFLSGLKKLLVQAGYYAQPQFMIIGAQKSGTKALRKYLSFHPNIVPTYQNEIHFFDQNVAYHRGLDWYHAHFPLPYRLGQEGITFDVTPAYLYYPASAERIHTYNRSIQLIVLLRDPVDRAFSAWNMFRNFFYKMSTERLLGILNRYDKSVKDYLLETLFQKEYPPFIELLQKEIQALSSANNSDLNLEPSFVRRGLYFEQLQRYFHFFGRDQILVIDSRHLKTNTLNMLDKVAEFIGMPKFAWKNIDLSHQHVGNYNEPMSLEAENMLREFYRKHNHQLYQLLDYDFGWK